MKRSKIFDSLASNAFDFLQQGIDEFDKAPKYSVIHFCAAVEMLLKARLMREHWSLIVAKPEQAKITKFIAGDFISVTLDEARVRLQDIAGENITDEAFNSFRTLANHRNKMIHFFHEDADKDGKVKEQIVADHCRSWFHLHLLLNRWDRYFKDFSKDIKRADRLMKGHRKYLAAKFKALKPELDDKRNEGSDPKICSACNFKAAIPNAIDRYIVKLHCLVCDHLETQVEIECPQCQHSIVIVGEGYSKCEHCGQKIEPELIKDFLTENDVRDQDDEDANCCVCDGYHTVINRSGNYFCVNCFDLSDRVEWCQWCNEPNTGDMEDSYWSGCNHCDGKSGWESGKDD